MRKFLVILTAVFVIFVSTLPIAATSAGNDGENYPTIPLYLELRYADKSVFMNVTDRYYYNNTVNHDSVTVSGRVLTTYLATKSIQADGVLMRKYITSEYGVAPVGFEITAPTFYLTRNEGATSFNQVRPYILLPDTVNVECVLTYDVFFGGDTPAGTVQRAISSPLGQRDDVYLFSFEEINNLANSTDWKSCRIDNLSLNSVTMTFSENASDTPETLGGTWVIDDGFDFGDLIQYSSDSVFYFPFTSNGKNFTGMSFVDGLWLYYENNVGQVESVNVWSDLLGWISQEYRTIYIDPDINWDDVIPGEESMNNVNDLEYWQNLFKEWITYNATKQVADGGYDGGPLLHWRYQVQTNAYINSYLNAYTAEYQCSGDSDASYLEGFRDGQLEGFDRGYSEGYDEGYGVGTGGGFKLGSFLVSVVGGFFDFQIMPGLSIGGIFGIFIGIMIFVAFLKHFAGG